ncbi:MAG: hypothetical protein HY617_00515 [Candidatus Sungbacteria bacterium]|nr:hypothetical protein [Candidatus Sungbacteria bacterium]
MNQLQHASTYPQLAQNFFLPLDQVKTDWHDGQSSGFDSSYEAADIFLLSMPNEF